MLNHYKIIKEALSVTVMLLGNLVSFRVQYSAESLPLKIDIFFSSMIDYFTIQFDTIIIICCCNIILSLWFNSRTWSGEKEFLKNLYKLNEDFFEKLIFAYFFNFCCKNICKILEIPSQSEDESTNPMY